MKTLIILNHDLTIDQVHELGEVIVLSDEHRKIWANIPPEADYSQVFNHIRPILDLIAYGDKIVCQGEFTAWSIVFDRCVDRDCQLLVATSRRETIETVIDGVSTKKAIFRHVQFRSIL